MNRTEKHDPGKANSKKPSWWTEGFESSWNKAKAETLADWHTFASAEKKLEESVAEQALALGHGARGAYEKLAVWSGELEETLKADWSGTGHEAEHAWEKVRSAVKHGWERGTKAVGLAAGVVVDGAIKAAVEAKAGAKAIVKEAHEAIAKDAPAKS